MKNKILKITCSVLCFFGLASCLGDSVGYDSGSGFAYITTDEYGLQKKIALVLSGNYVYSIKSGVIDTADLNVGDCALLTYKVYSDKYSGGIWYTDDVQLGQKFPRNEQAMLQLGTPSVVGAVDTVDVFNKMNIQMAASNDIVKDKWYLGYRAELQNYQDATLSFYYDERAERQTGLSKDTVYLDVRIHKGIADKDKKGSVVDRNAVADFSLLRRVLLTGLAEQKGYFIRFRYYVNDKDKNVSKTKEVLADAVGYMQNSVTAE